MRTNSKMLEEECEVSGTPCTWRLISTHINSRYLLVEHITPSNNYNRL